MRQGMLLIGISLCVAAALVTLGGRVLAQAMKRGALPDRLIGLFFTPLGLGVPPALLAPQAAFVPPEWAAPAMAVGHLLLSLAFGSLYGFAWVCFGHRSAWRKALALTSCAVLLLLWIALGVARHFEPPGGAIIRITALVRFGALVWAFGESFSYYIQMRKRLKLGLIDPAVANRFLLWSGWTGSLLAALMIVIAARFLIPTLDLSVPTLVTRSLLLSLCTLGSSASVCLAMAFFPPRWYTARLYAKAESLSASAARR
jgi:hypothetical protein